MGNVLDDLAIYITAQSTLFTMGASLVKGRLPDKPTTCVALIEGLSFEPPIETFGASGSFGGMERPQIQIVSRGGPNDYKKARDNSEAVFKIVRSVYNTSTGINGTKYHMIKVRSTPYYQGEDDNSRHIISFTVDVWKDVSS